MTKIMVVDIETTGFFNKGGLIVEIGAVSLDLASGEVAPLFDMLIRESGFSDKHRDSWIFKNSDLKFEDVLRARHINNHLIRMQLQHLFDLFPATAWNKKFDFEFLRDRGFKIRELDCPMMLATNICKLPGPYGYKWPKVEEAWRYFFPDISYVEAHRGLDDAMHEAKLVHELYKRGVFKVEGVLF